MYASKNYYSLREENKERIYFHRIKQKAREQRKPFGENSGKVCRINFVIIALF